MAEQTHVIDRHNLIMLVIESRMLHFPSLDLLVGNWKIVGTKVSMSIEFLHFILEQFLKGMPHGGQ